MNRGRTEDESCAASNPMPMTDDEQLLIALQGLAAELDQGRIERWLDQRREVAPETTFNVYEAAGLGPQELRHSDLLAHFLDPRGAHGLGAAFARALLTHALQRGQFDWGDLSAIDLSSLEVRREWQHIDLLLLDRLHRFVVVIENKLLSREHSQQLQRYRAVVRQEFSGYRSLHLFLTIDGNSPSDETYVALSYRDVMTLIEDLSPQASGDVTVGLRHYADLLRRNIVNDGELEALCRRISLQHPDALEALEEWRKTMLRRATAQVRRWVDSGRRFKLSGTDSRWVGFAPAAWDRLPVQQAGHGWDDSHRLLQFEFWAPNGKLELFLGPGKPAARQAVLRAAAVHGLDAEDLPDLDGDWSLLYARQMISDGSAPGIPTNWEDELKASWDVFVADDLRVLTAIVKQASD